MRHLIGIGGKRIPNPESAEQRILAQWLDFRGLLWCHPSPNVYRGVARSRTAAIAGAIARRHGVKAGVPDVLVFSRVPSRPTVRGVAIELKRADGGVVSAEQVEWIERLEGEGWVCDIARGADAAIKFLERLGL